ncbi:MAG TPA: hypothetical protein VKE40_28010 [Gemmataceae bacterium]|nr:hypothetical protein [Gemmataceae bacterium]
MRTRLLIVLAGLIWVLAGGRAEAGYQFQFTNSAGVATNAFVIDQGSTIDIRVYLVQTSPDTGLSGSGLDAAGTRLTFNQTIANVASTGAITANPAFDFATKSTGTGSASLNLTQDSGSAPVTAPTSGADANRILIGTFTFTGVNAGTTTVLTSDPHLLSDDNVLHNGSVLDSMIANSSAAITVNAIPEPGTLVLTGLFAAGLAAASIRRLRRPAVG